jgi:hypothetical protein
MNSDWDDDTDYLRAKGCGWASIALAIFCTVFVAVALLILGAFAYFLLTFRTGG